jgi:hypothetical protein
MASIVQFNLTKPEPTVIRLVDKRRTNPVTIEQGDEDALGRMAERYGALAAQAELGLPYLGRPMSQQEELFVAKLAVGMTRVHAEVAAARAALPMLDMVPMRPAKQPSSNGKKTALETSEVDPSDEEHDTTEELAKRWRKSVETIRKIVCVEPGVLKISRGTGKRTSYSVPKSVSRRIHKRLSIPDPA